MVYQVSSSLNDGREQRSRHSSGTATTDRLSINGFPTSPIDSSMPNGSINHYNDNNSGTLNVNGGGGSTPMQQPKLEFSTLEEKDAFLIFRALCKLSIKQLPDDQDPR